MAALSQTGGGGGRFRRQNRLTRPAEFKRVFSTSCRSRDSRFTVLAIRNNAGQARLGLVVSKKSAPLAVDRNRVKRLIRESFRRRHRALAGLDIVVMAQKGIAKINNDEILASLSKLWKKTIKCKDSLSA